MSARLAVHGGAPVLDIEKAGTSEPVAGITVEQ